MAFIHCTQCEWNQDDFWSEDYNPVTVVTDYLPNLLRAPLDNQYTTRITSRDMIARVFEEAAANIRNMRWHTLQHWRDTPPDQRSCPLCGQPTLTID